MAILKEDGSLDVERINSLPVEEFMDVMGDLTEEQVEEYFSTIPINESIGTTTPLEVDYTLEEDIKRNGIINVDDFINNMRKKYGI